MSAIYGIFDKNNKGIPERWKTGMKELLSHRIVDGEGAWQGDQIYLGKCLMAISPESYIDNAPLEIENYIICGDIDIYNREEFIQKLEIEDTGQTDTLLTALSYQKWQNNFVDYMVGDFALAIWDKSTKQLACFVDHIGVRQFHYHNTDDYFIFSTEIKTFKAIEHIKFTLFDKKLEDYLINFNYNKTTTADTYFENIEKLTAANCIFCENKNFNITNYWKPITSKKLYHLSLDECAERLSGLIEKSVTERMRTKHKIGITLSGGLDSSSVACLAARKLNIEGKILYSVSSVLPENYVGDATDEREYINEVLKQEPNIEAEYEIAEENNIFNEFEETVSKAYEIPNFTYYMDNLLNKRFANNQVRIVLTGYGGDVTVSYSGILVLPLLLKKGKWTTLIDIISQRSKIYNETKIHIWLNYVFKMLFSAFIKETVKDVFSRKLFKLQFNPIDPARYSFFEKFKIKYKYFSELNKEQQFYSNMWNIDQNWFYSEIEVSNAYNKLQQRHPLTDKRIIDLLYQIPPNYFMAKGRHRGLLRQAMKDILPKHILFRKGKKYYLPNLLNLLFAEKGQIANILCSFTDDEILSSGKIESELKKLKNSRDINLESFNLLHISSFYKKFKNYFIHL